MDSPKGASGNMRNKQTAPPAKKENITKGKKNEGFFGSPDMPA